MRLFMTTDAVGGVWTYALDLAHGIAAYGVSTTLAVLGPEPTESQRDQAHATLGVDLIETGIGLDWQAESADAVASLAEQVAAYARRARANVIHLNSPSLAAFGKLGTHVVGACHSCVGTWWDATQPDQLPGYLAWQTKLLAVGYAKCDVLVAPSAAFSKSTKRRYGVHSHVIHNGRTAPLVTAARRERCVVTAGRLWDCAKNLQTLDLAANLIEAPVYAAGSLQMPPGDPVEIVHVTPLGHLDPDELRECLLRSPIFVSLALYEPFGLTVLEAAQCGCALVLSDIPSFRELWSGVAIFVPPTDVQGCASVVNALLNDPEAAAGWGAAARARAQTYTVEAMARGMMGVYCSLLAQSGVAA